MFLAQKKLKEKANELGYENLFIHENLCTEYKYIYEVAASLKKDKHIYSFWSFNGIVHLKLGENDRPKKLFHISDIDKHVNFDLYN